MAKLSSFGVIDMMDVRAKLRDAFDPDQPVSFEDAAQRLTGLFHRELVDDAGRPACALVRIFKTLRVDELDDDLRAWAQAAVPGATLEPHVRCLTLMGTTGSEPMWNSRRESRGHKAIPLLDPRAVAAIPMVAQLIRELGFDIATVLQPSAALMLSEAGRSNGVFYVANAPGSPYIAAQEEFVRRHGIASVIGFGGLLTKGDLVAAILFSKVPITPAVAEHFKILGLNFVLAMLPFGQKPLFTRPEVASSLSIPPSNGVTL